MAGSLRPGPAGLDIPVPALGSTLSRCLPNTPGPAATWRLPCDNAGDTEVCETDHDALPEPLWMDLPLSLPEGPGGRMVRDLRSVRIEAEGATLFGEERRLAISSAESARHLVLQLLALPVATERLHHLRHSHEGYGLAEWATLGLVTGELVLISRPLPYWMRQPGTGPARPKPGGGGGKTPGKVDETHWIEIVLKNERDEPMPNTAYEIITADKARHTGTTDKKGHGRLDGIVAGPCEVFFPELDNDEWKRG